MMQDSTDDLSTQQPEQPQHNQHGDAVEDTFDEDASAWVLYTRLLLALLWIRAATKSKGLQDYWMLFSILAAWFTHKHGKAIHTRLKAWWEGPGTEMKV